MDMTATVNSERSTEGYSSVPATTTWRYALFALHLALSVLILSGNSLTVLAIWRTPELRTQPNIYVLNLAVADGIVGVNVSLIAFMFVDVAERAFDSSRYLCIALYVLVHVGCSQSLLLLVAMAVDRLVYVVYPYLYVRCFTERRTKIVVAVSWLFVVSSGTLPSLLNVFTPEKGCAPGRVINRTFEGLVQPLEILAVLAITSACYIKIACVAQKQRRAVTAQVQMSREVQLPQRDSQEQVSPSSQRSVHETTNGDGSTAGQTGGARQVKSLGMFVTVNCLFAVCWMPFVVHNLLLDVVLIPDTVSSVVSFLAMSNSAMNTVILARMNRHFARAYRKLLTQGRCCSGRGN